MMILPTARIAMRALLLALAVVSTNALAIDPAGVAEAKRTRAALYLNAVEAYTLKQQMGQKAYLVDVRTRAEVAYLGMATVADAHIPYVEHPDDARWDDKRKHFKIDANSDFGPELARRMAGRGLAKGDTVILLCRSGDRSARAANLLADLGYTKVFTVIDGFEGDVATEGPQAGQRVVNGWKNAQLPWSYKLDRDKMYFPAF